MIFIDYIDWKQWLIFVDCCRLGFSKVFLKNWDSVVNLYTVVNKWTDGIIG